MVAALAELIIIHIEAMPRAPAARFNLFSICFSLKLPNCFSIVLNNTPLQASKKNATQVNSITYKL